MATQSIRESLVSRPKFPNFTSLLPVNVIFKSKYLPVRISSLKRIEKKKWNLAKLISVNA